MNDRQGKDKRSRRNRRGADQDNVNRAMETLAAAAVRAIRKMLFVVATHGGGDTRNVVTPTGQDVADDGIDTAVLAAIAWRYHGLAVNLFRVSVISGSHFC